MAVPPEAVTLMKRIPDHFIDDGCSNAPDRILGTSIRWACRIHDWRYCTRAHPRGTLTQSWRIMADQELRDFIRQALPWWKAWIARAYYGAVNWFGGYRAFDSCGPAVGGTCRHGLTWEDQPEGGTE